MSEIDGYQHSCVGLLFGLPVYHPIEDHDENINTNSLIVGGGSGEHSMFIVSNLEGCLQEYLFYHGDEYPEQDCEWLCNWSIEESYHFFPKIRPFMKNIGVNSAEKAIIMALGDFLRCYGGHFVSNWRHLQPETLNKAMNLPNRPWEILDMTSKIGGLGKYIHKGKVQWGFSFIDEINAFDEIRIQRETEVIASNTNFKIIMKSEDA